MYVCTYVCVKHASMHVKLAWSVRGISFRPKEWLAHASPAMSEVMTGLEGRDRERERGNLKQQ